MLKVKRKTDSKTKSRSKKKFRIRKKVFGQPDRPRLTVFKSLKHMYAQIVDDLAGKTLVAASTREKSLSGKSGKEAAKIVGQEVAKRALDKKIESVVFDRNGYQYHGKIQVLADAAREVGLKF